MQTKLFKTIPKRVGVDSRMPRTRSAIIAVAVAALSSGCSDSRHETATEIATYENRDHASESVDSIAQPEQRNGIGRDDNLVDSDSARQAIGDNVIRELQYTFVQLDNNGDGEITVDEWPADDRVTFTSADLDNNAGVSREEYLDSHNDEVVSRQ